MEKKKPEWKWAAANKNRRIAPPYFIHE